MATKYVKAVHALTGFIQEIPESHLKLFPHFSVADEGRVAEARRQEEIEVYGEPLEGQEITDVVVDRPDSTWRKDDLVDYAAERGVETEGKTKAEILEALDAQEGVN